LEPKPSSPWVDLVRRLSSSTTTGGKDGDRSGGSRDRDRDGFASDFLALELCSAEESVGADAIVIVMSLFRCLSRFMEAESPASMPMWRGDNRGGSDVFIWEVVVVLFAPVEEADVVVGGLGFADDDVWPLAVSPPPPPPPLGRGGAGERVRVAVAAVGWREEEYGEAARSRSLSGAGDVRDGGGLGLLPSR